MMQQYHRCVDTSILCFYLVGDSYESTFISISPIYISYFINAIWTCMIEITSIINSWSHLQEEMTNEIKSKIMRPSKLFKNVILLSRLWENGRPWYEIPPSIHYQNIFHRGLIITKVGKYNNEAHHTFLPTLQRQIWLFLPIHDSISIA